MKKISSQKIVTIITIVVGLVMVIAPFAALAQFQQVPCGGFNVPCNVGNNSLTDLIIRVIQILLALAGLIAVLVLVLGGFRYVTSFGNEDATKEAKKMIINAIIGILIIILSFVIVQVVTTVAHRAASTGSV